MKPYIPDSLPLQNLDYRYLFAFIGDANAELARYDGLLQGIPNPAVMLSPLTTREAVLSSKIEGTQATIDEVLQQEAGLLQTGEKYKDIQEISNYRKTLFLAAEHLQDYPIRLGLIREMHKKLLNSVRGENKTPGEFRTDQNWIGKPGCTIDEAMFIPPAPLQMLDFLRDWESYINIDDVDFLLQTAVMHAQFELIHPFKDGNGRIGRILIPLFLFQKKKLSQPMFYLSEYLEAHRDEYYQRLRDISGAQDWNGWIAFFLQAVTYQAQENSTRARAIMALYEDMKNKIQQITHSQYAVYLLDAIFSKPIFTTSDFADQLQREHTVHKKTTLRLLGQLKKSGIMIELQPARGRKSSVLCFPDLINLAEGRKII